MKRISTIYKNVKLIVDEFELIVGIEVDGSVTFMLGDTVMVSGDCHGYITPGIQHPGMGTIIAFRKDETDYFVRVLMELTHEVGWCKINRLEKF